MPRRQIPDPVVPVGVGTLPGVLRRAAVPAGVRPWWRRWRHSLQVRVVAATVVLGTFVVGCVGSLLLARIGTGLVDARRDAVELESLQEYEDARAFVQGYGVGDDTSTLANDLVSRLQGPADSPSRIVLLMHPQTSSASTSAVDRASTGVTREMLATLIPDGLRTKVNGNPDTQQVATVSMPALDGGAGVASEAATPAIMVGSMIDLGSSYGGMYELYFVYRLDREVGTLALVQRTLLVGGMVLVLLVGAVAWIVTRQVVDPVRQAARIAEELASGNLDRRMTVRGEDDLARLARAFNDMAVSLESQIHRLEELSLVQRRFVSDVSHELRTPLTTIRMAGELIFEARDDFDPMIRRSSELLHDQLDRFESLLADLLEVSRFDAGAAALETEPVDVRAVVEEVVAGFTPLVERRAGEIGVFVPDEPCMALIDRRRLARIVRNLVGNALEHGEDAPIQVIVAQDVDAVAVSVRDHGVGLEPEQVAMVFDRFWRADPARARQTGGTGLGLAISLEDAHLHGGWLEVWGAPRLGAHFLLTLPRRRGTVLQSSPLALVPDLPDVAGAQDGPLGATFSGRPTSVTSVPAGGRRGRRGRAKDAR